jgi:hypothetical protein
MGRILPLVAVILLLSAIRVRADDIPRCLTLPPAEDVAAADLPPILRAMLAHDIGTFALPGQPFDASDVVAAGVSRRLIWVRKRGTRWVVALEQGGRAYHDTVLSYELGYDNTIAGIRAETAFPSTVCQMTERALWR